MIGKSMEVRAGFVGFGEVNTPREFIDGRCHTAAEALRARGIKVFETAPVSDDPEGQQVQRAVDELSAQDFDVLVLCVAGWIPSWAVMKIVEQFRHLPMRKIDERGYDGFSFCDVDGVKKLLKFAPAGALTLLHDLKDVPTVPENDSYGAVTQLVVKYLTGKTPAYMEFYEFTEKSALMGVPDYVPAAAVDGKVTVMPNAFGSFGGGLLNVSKVRTGLVTIARLAQVGGELVLHVVKGMAQRPEAWEEAGWAPPAPQLPSIEVVFDFPADEFLAKVMGQHYIVSYGDNIQLFNECCDITSIRMV